MQKISATLPIIRSDIPINSSISDEIIKICLEYDEIYVFEEGERDGGIAQKLCTALVIAGYKGKFSITAVDGFIRHASVATQLRNAKLDTDGMREIIGG